MIVRLCPPMLIWAARDLGRRPWRTLATILSLFGLALLLGGTLLCHQALTQTADRLLADAPAIVVRRAAATGWAPLPIDSAMATVARVPGVLNPHPRLWGLVRVSGRTVTVMAEAVPSKGAATTAPYPRNPGEVAVGSGLTAVVEDQNLRFDQHPQRSYKVVRHLAANLAMAVHDTVLMHPDDLRDLLGLPPGHASDLTIEVFHAEAVEALSRDLAEAFPWPVQISRRSVALGRLDAAMSRRATLVAVAYVPAMLALVVLGLASAVDSERGRAQAGLLRALGWTGRDFLRLSLWRWACLTIPGAGLGLAAAYLLIFTPADNWMGALLFGWTADPPGFHLSSAGSVQGLLAAAALVGLPHLVMVVATGLRHAASDPRELMEEGQ